ncbi:transposase, partial [Candidatus Magnetomorum sp. HK-1]
KLAKDDKYIGGDLPGFFGVLHTWGSMLQYHPHIHFVVTGGAVSLEDDQWHPSRTDFFLPVKALSKIIKTKFQDEMKKAGLLHNIPKSTWEADWNINSKAIGNGKNAIAYLSRYVFKVAIADSRIVSIEDRKVTFQYKKKNSNRMRTCTLDVMEFIRRFLQHVLPSGFMKVRYYGFLNPNCSLSIEHVSALIELAYGFDIEIPSFEKKPLKPLCCENCGGSLKFCYFIIGGSIEPNVDTG